MALFHGYPPNVVMSAIGSRTGRSKSRGWLPLPIPDFGQVSTVFVNVLLVFDQHVLELRFQVDALLRVAGMVYGGAPRR